MIKRLPDEIAIAREYHALLESAIYGTLSTIRVKDGLISTNPVAFLWDGERMRISTLKSRVKYHNLTADPRVTFCVVSPTDITRYVEVRGRASLEDDPDGSFMRAQFRAGMGVDPPDDLDPPGAERAIINIHPLQVSSPRIYGGRFERQADTA